MPIEQIPETPNSTSLRLLREAFWYKELCSIYPYGLNDNIKGVGNISKLKKEIIVWNLFNRLSHKRRHRRSNLKSTGSSNNAAYDPEWLKERLPLYKNVGFLAKLKRDTFALPARHLHRLLNSVQCLIDTPETPFPLRLMLMIKDVIKARASASVPKHPTKATSPEGFLKIVFHNKGVEK